MGNPDDYVALPGNRVKGTRQKYGFAGEIVSGIVRDGQPILQVMSSRLRLPVKDVNDVDVFPRWAGLMYLIVGMPCGFYIV